MWTRPWRAARRRSSRGLGTRQPATKRSRSSREPTRGAGNLSRSPITAANNPQQLERPLRSNTKMTESAGPQEKHDSTHGAHVALRRQERRNNCSSSSRQMMENLQMAHPDSPATRYGAGVNELGDMIRKSRQQLRDKTFKQGQDSRRDPLPRMRRPKQGRSKQGHLQPASGRPAPIRALKRLQEEAAKRAAGCIGPSAVEKGQAANRAAGSTRRPGRRRERPWARPISARETTAAGWARATDGAVDSQGRAALDALSKGARALQGDAEGDVEGGRQPGQSPPAGNRTRQRQTIRSDGRCMGREW